jgi:hypothetical protein
LLKYSAHNDRQGKFRDLPRRIQFEEYDQQLTRTRTEYAQSRGMANPGQKLLISTTPLRLTPQVTARDHVSSLCRAGTAGMRMPGSRIRRI